MIDRNREGWFRPVYKYPLGWARLAAGSIPKLLVMLAIHIYCAFALVSEPNTNHSHLSFALVVVAFFPGLYLYALYRLVNIIEKYENDDPVSASGK